MLAESLLEVLADGAWHGPAVSDARIATEHANLTFGALARQSAGRFHDWGLSAEIDESDRCRLRRPLDLLDRRQLTDALLAGVPGLLGTLTVATELRSTSDELLRDTGSSDAMSGRVAGSDAHQDYEPYPYRGDGWLNVCIAEFQTAGRGRRGRRWHGPMASGLCLSVGCRLASDPSSMSALPLVTGVTVRRVLRELTGISVALKWPNDLVWQGRKLGGILVERTMDGAGGSRVVIGLGLNVALPDTVEGAFSDWKGDATDLAEIVRSGPSRDGERRPLKRTWLASALVIGLGRMLAGVRAGVPPRWQDEWRIADELAGRRVRVFQQSGEYTGIAVGVDDQGALLVETAPGITRRVISAEVSVRREPMATSATVQPRLPADDAP